MTDYETMYNEYEVSEAVGEPQEFVIDSAGLADWAVEKIRADRQRRDVLIDAAKERIAELEMKITAAKEECDKKTAFLLSALDRYLDELPGKQTKTQLSIELPSGKLVRKLARMDYAKDEAALLGFVRQSAPEYIRTEEKVNWAELKKDLQIVGETAVRKSTGEIVEGISIVEKPAQFDIV